MSNEKQKADQCFENLFQVYSDWIKKVSTVDKDVLAKYQDRFFATYDSVESFFRTWMEDTSENRRKTLKLLSDILKLT